MGNGEHKSASYALNMNTKLILRIIIDLLIVWALIQGFWFLVIIFGAIGLWRYEQFYEIIVAGIGYDALFGMVPRMGIHGYYGTITGIILYIVASLFKKLVRKSA